MSSVTFLALYLIGKFLLEDSLVQDFSFVVCALCLFLAELTINKILKDQTQKE